MIYDKVWLNTGKAYNERNIKMKKGDKVRVRTEAIMAFTLVVDIVAFFLDFRSERKKKTITYLKILKFDFRLLLKVLRQL